MERISLILSSILLAGCIQTSPQIPEFPKVPEILITDDYSLKTLEQYRSEKKSQMEK